MQRRVGGQRGVVVGLVVLTAAAVGVLAACTSSSTPQTTTSTRNLGTVTHTRPADTPTFKPDPVTTVPPLPYGRQHPRKGEKDHACPYIKTGLNETSSGGVNLADIEGDRVYRTTILTKHEPVGCRFYFYAPPYEAIAEIRPRTFATPTDAYNAMILTARTGHELITERSFYRSLVGISFRTRFFGPDGRRDWAFVFAKGRVMVTVYTQRTDTSRNAVYIAKAIAGKF